MAQFDRFNMFEAMAPIYQARDARDQQQFQNAFAMQRHADDQQYRAASMDMQRQELGLSRERLDMAKQQIEMSMLETLQQMDAQQQARELEELIAERQAIGAALGAGDMQALAALGIEGPEAAEAAEAILAATGSVLARAAGVTAMMDARPKAPEPMSAPGKVNADIERGFLPQGTPLSTPQTVINTGDAVDTRPVVGTPPAGYQRRFNEQTGSYEDSLIPGSEAYLERQAQATEAASGRAKETEKDRQEGLRLGTTLASLALNIAEIENGGIPVTGPVGWLGGLMPGTPQTDFRGRNEQITDSAALAEIQRMRDNSKTGGAVGALTDGERVAIGQAVTAINSSSSAREYLRAAKAYRDLALNLAYGEGNWELSEDGQSVRTRTASSSAPPGVSPEIWQHMTQEERALWN